MELSYADFMSILNMGIDITTDRDRYHILNSILENGMKVTNCDASTLYLYEEDMLKFRIMKTISKQIDRGTQGEFIQDMPPVPFAEENVCAYTAIHRTIVNIDDVYASDKFDFSGPKRYDMMTDYRTKSMLVIPLENNENELIGVLQMINAQDDHGQVVAFQKQHEIIIRSLGSLAAITLTNLQYVEEIKVQLYSFVEAMATAVDERTPYNGFHTRNMAAYALRLAYKVNEKHEMGLSPRYFDEAHMKKLELSALLHDIGKIVTPRSIMNRATRLERGMELTEGRLKLIQEYYEVDYMSGRIDEKTYQNSYKDIQESIEFVSRINNTYILEDWEYEKVQQLAAQTYVRPDQKVIRYITESERENLSIRRGNLSAASRKVMEEHVEYTAKILGKVRFSGNYKDIPIWAGEHHEFLDGTGYPNQLTGENIPLEARILTIADIYEALTAKDRPYKESMSKEAAIDVLRDMAAKGKVDKELVEWLAEEVKEDGNET